MKISGKTLVLSVVLLYPGVMGVVIGEFEPEMPIYVWLFFCLLPALVYALFVSKKVK